MTATQALSDLMANKSSSESGRDGLCELTLHRKPDSSIDTHALRQVLRVMKCEAISQGWSQRFRSSEVRDAASTNEASSDFRNSGRECLEMNCSGSTSRPHMIWSSAQWRRSWVAIRLSCTTDEQDCLCARTVVRPGIGKIGRVEHFLQHWSITELPKGSSGRHSGL